MSTGKRLAEAGRGLDMSSDDSGEDGVEVAPALFQQVSAGAQHEPPPGMASSGRDQAPLREGVPGVVRHRCAQCVSYMG